MRTSLLLMSLIVGFNVLSAQPAQKNRVIILTDIEADPDDTQSLVRLLLYSNEIDIEGIIATTSCWLTDTIHPKSITRIIKAYDKVQPNLLKHDADFPKGADLLAIVKNGLPIYGMKGVGEGMDSEGSEWIIESLEKKDDRPLWISTWGGANTLAQALYKVRKTKSKKEAKRLVAKLRVYAISDQDDSGLWLRTNFPELFYIVSPGDDYDMATWKGLNQSDVAGIDSTTIGNSWLAEHIQQGHGPLGAMYPDVAWFMEGDTPAFLSLIPNGLNSPDNPNWGGWGGRYEYYLPDVSKLKDGSSIVEIKPETRKFWTNATDSFSPYYENEFGRSILQSKEVVSGFKQTLGRWRDAIQNDFAARMDWCELSFEDANHPPVPVLSHPEEIVVTSGKTIRLEAIETTDPDGDSFSFLWFTYPEAGTSKKELINTYGPANLHFGVFRAPDVDKEVTAHIILKVTDRGVPRLSSYKRIIVRIQPD